MPSSMSEAHATEAQTANTNAAAQNGMSGLIWILGVIGAAVYYIQSADGFWSGVGGFLKALVWPAFLVYELLQSVGA